MDSLSKIGFSTMFDLLQFRANTGGANIAFSYLEDGEQVSSSITFSELAQRAQAIAAHLQMRTQRGDRVLLVYGPSLDYIVSFFACIYAGVVAVPALPPTNGRTLQRLQLIADDAQPRVAMATAAVFQRVSKLESDTALTKHALEWLTSDELPAGTPHWIDPGIDGNDIAFLQYTSGSTGAPKGVKVSHANILANVQAIHAAFSMQESDTIVSWLPPHHDMGLIGKILYPVYAGCHCVQFPPAAFLMRPHRWLQAISTFQARITAAPNFAYELCVDKISEEKRKSLDLSSLQYMLNGAEPIRPGTVRRFVETFSECGLRPDVVTPVYGLAESTLLVSHAQHQKHGETQRSLRIDKKALSLSKRALLASDIANDSDAIEIISVGPAKSEESLVVIADPDTLAACPEGAVGEIWVTGSSVAQGYWNRPEESLIAFAGQIEGRGQHHLRTGDLGFILQGELYVTGRIKEMMIFNGRNIYPQDVEATIELLDGAFRKNGCAVFSIERDDLTQLVIVQEIESRGEPQTDGLVGKIRAELAEQHEIFDCAHILLVKSGRIPRTSSGKIQRGRCREYFLGNEFNAIWQWSEEGRIEPSVAKEGSGPRSETEHKLAAIWKEVLDQDVVSIHDSFFALGGQSIMATQMIILVRQRFGIELPIYILFDATNIALLGQEIDNILKETKNEVLPDIKVMARDGEIPLSFGQQRLWLVEQLRPESGFFNSPIALRLSGDLNIAALQASLSEIVRRHESLRTVFRVVGDEPRQFIQPPGPVALQIADLTDIDPTERQTRVAELMLEAIQLPFDLATDSVIRVSLLQLAAQEHVLLLTLHHIVSDGWSMGVLTRELTSFYPAFIRAESSPLPELAVQYADYAQWQREWLKGDLLEQQVSYWKEQLADAPDLLSLPTDRPRPAIQSNQGARHYFVVDKHVLADLESIAERENATLFMVLVTAFQIMLARYSGQNDICIGTPIANRSNTEVEAMIGFFVNSLVLRTHVDLDLDFATLLQRVRTVALEAYTHQDVPFEHLVELLAPVRQMSHAPLFQAVLTMLNTPVSDLTLPGLTLEKIENRLTMCEVDLRLNVTEENGGLSVYFEYSTDLFDPETIARMSSHFVCLLDAIGCNTKVAVGDLPMMSEVEQHQSLVEWNDSATDLPQTAAVHQLFELQARLRPDHPALAFQGVEISYVELNRRANRLARHLQTLGVGPEMLVGICVERSPEMIVGLLAVLKAGGAYLPLDPNYPTARLSYMVSDANLALLLTQDSLLDILPASSVYTVCLDEEASWQSYSDTDLACKVAADSLAYVIYTSGSTGLPKGTLLHHGGLVNLAHAQAKLFAVTPTHRILQFASFNFDASTWEIFMALSWGATLCMASRDELMPGPELEQSIQKLGVSMATLPPTALALLASEALPGLETIVVAGEACSTSLVDMWRDGRKFFNAYGPTESTVCASAFDCSDTHDGVPPIGLPIDNMRLYVLDSRLQPVPVGVTGELYIAGMGLARGYANQAGLTAERFIPDPFSAKGSARLYKSGDLVRRLPDGNIEFLGRIDNQFKIRGFRVELGEVEAALTALRQIKEAVAVVREDQAGDKRLLAYLVAREGGNPAALEQEALRKALLRSLPEHMVPAHFVLLERFPLTPNGKIDHKALPEPDITRSEADYVAPRNEMEQVLAEIWGDVLKLERVGIHDDFFVLGGHSLRATTVVARIRQRFNVDLALRTLFEVPTIAGLALRIESAETDTELGKAASPAIERAELQSAYPMSAGQRRLWILHRLDPTNTAHHVATVLDMPVGTKLVALEQSLSVLVERHEVLRTVFLETDAAVPLQRIEAAQAVQLVQREIASEEQLQTHVSQFHQRAFDLTRGPLFRAELLRTWDGRVLLAWCMHEIIADGSSSQILQRELTMLLQAHEQGTQLAFHDLAIQYKDYAVWQNKLFNAEGEQASRLYWHGQLNDELPRLQLPFDFPITSLTSMRGARYQMILKGALFDRVTALCRARQVTLFMLVQASLSVWLTRLTGQGDVLIATPVAGRNMAELEPLIGFFLNTLLLRTRVDGGESFDDLLSRSKDATLQALQHQHYPFEQLVDELSLPRPVNQFPVTPVFFNTLNFLDRELTSEALETGHVALAREAKVELAFTLQEYGDALSFHCQYRSDLFKPETIEYLMQQWVALLEQVMLEPEKAIGKLVLFEAPQILALQAPYARFASVPLEAKAPASVLIRLGQVTRSQPEAVALDWQGEQWTYAQLDAKSNRIAHRLRELGSKQGDVVALLLEHPLNHIASVIGAMKAGAVFVTLESSDPLPRLQDLARRCSPRWWIAEASTGSVLEGINADAQEPEGLWLSEAESVAQLKTLTALELAQDVDVDIELDAQAPCYIFFTSGSSGQPKAILGRSQSLAHFIDWEIATFGLDNSCRVSQLTAPTFDAFLRDLFVPLCAGGRLCVPPMRKQAPDQMLDWLADVGVTLIHCVPSVLRSLLAYSRTEAVSQARLTQLERVCLSGEALLPVTVQEWRDTFGAGIELVNFYGASETTMIRCYHRVTEADLKQAYIPIGKPIADTQAIVLDESGRPCAAGVAGEIYVRSAYFTLGYYRDAELTAQVFVESPLRPGTAEKVYRSGDLGILHGDGNLQFLGRRDGQVKVNGVRIEIAEIENVLLGHSQVKEAAVVASDGTDGATTLHAYVVTAGPMAGRLRDYLAERLPAALLPHSVSELDTLPMTSSGKVDRKALIARNQNTVQVAAHYVAPVTEMQKALAGLFEEVLGRKQVGLHDDFFALGGHSLRALMVLARLRKSFKVDIPLRILFEAPTVAGLAEKIAQAPVVVSQAIVPVTRTEAMPISYAQQRLWFLDQYSPGNASYNIPIRLWLIGELRIDVLTRTLNEIVRRHEALRTTFNMVDGTPVQIIAPRLELTLEVSDLTDLALSEREARAQWLAQDEAVAPFDLASGPLIRVGLIRLEEQRHVILFTVHHIVADGWSMGVLVREVAALYSAYLEGKLSPLTDLAIQYVDFAHWQRQWLTGQVLQRQLDYWTQQLKAAPVLLTLPTDRPRPVEVSYCGAEYIFEISAQTGAALRQLGQQVQATPFMVMHAAFSALLSRYSGQDDLCIGTPVASRNRAELEPLIGCFINTLVLRSRIDRQQSFENLLQDTRDTTLDAYAHQDVPFEQLVELLQPERHLSHPPLFQVLLILQNAPLSELDLPGLKWQPMASERATTKFDLTLNIAEVAEGLHCRFEYNTDLFDASTIARMAGHFMHLLEAIVADPQVRVGDLPLLGEAEQNQLLHDWNDTTQSATTEGTLQRQFEQQAACAPEAVAVVFEDQQLSYGELNAKANQLAHYLRQNGVGADDLVGICVERSLDMMVGLLAILKAGGAYIPLDPAYPQERLSYMLADARPALLLTQDSLKSGLSADAAYTFCLDSDWEQLADYNDDNLPSIVQGDNLAYVIYTSGSTGQPKGVGVTHTNLINLLCSMQQSPGMTASDVLLGVTSLSFDIAALELYLPLISGGKLVLCSRDATANPQQLCALIQTGHVTMMQATPSTWRMLNEYGWPIQAHPLKILCGGEALPVELMTQLHQHVPGIWNMYGPTETTIWSAAKLLHAEEQRVTLGGPIANTALYILDASYNLVPIGVAGELHIAGAGLARGYLNRPDLTADKFIPNPHGQEAGSRLYKTGDLARYLPDGSVEYLGRIDNQVKIRGFRIELGEIETALNGLAEVKEAVVIAREDNPGDKRLVAYIVPEQGVQTENEKGSEQTSFSLFYFGSDTYETGNKYALYLEAAKFADAQEFEAIWTPERHFHEVGSLYPNPSVLSAALSTITSKVRLRAGSVVLPLHNPIRVAEEWSVIDNLSNGRTGMAIASGWHPRDFVLQPQNYETRKKAMAEGIETLKKLWKGESLPYVDGAGSESTIQIYPKPIQAELPLWITAAGNPETFMQAGRMGLNVLTHLLGQTIPELAKQIELYREARRQHGHDPESGRVTVMVHTYVGQDFEQTLEQARGPFMKYMRSHLGLLSSLVKSLNVKIDQPTEQDLENIVAIAFERYSRTASLIGTPQTCLPVMNELSAIGVNEVACLVDWMETREALAGLEHLARLRELVRTQGPSPEKLRQKLKAMLPEYMVPSTMMMLGAMPLTPNGKIDRKALPAPDASRNVIGYVAPNTPTEEKLTAIWVDVLKVERVGIYDNFFEIGGHSLLVTQLSARIAEHFGRRLSLRDLFQAVTVAEMAALIDAEFDAAQQSNQQSIAKIPRTLHRAKIQGSELVIAKNEGM